jgi:NAD(P)-dependent dehydrogenase (short-subunit alcohol dehydrogenase family)
VSPAAVDTGILTDFKNAFGPMVDKNLSLVGRPGDPDEIANVAVFLASPESAWIRGSDIVVDGGMGALVQSSTMELSINDI